MHSVLSRLTEVTEFRLMAFTTPLLIEFCILERFEWVTGQFVSTVLQQHNGTDNVSTLIIRHGGSGWLCLRLIKKSRLKRAEKGLRTDKSCWRKAHLVWKFTQATEREKKLKICHKSNLKSISRWYTTSTFHCLVWGKTDFVNRPFFLIPKSNKHTRKQHLDLLQKTLSRMAFPWQPIKIPTGRPEGQANWWNKLMNGWALIKWLANHHEILFQSNQPLVWHQPPLRNGNPN